MELYILHIICSTRLDRPYILLEKDKSVPQTVTADTEILDTSQIELPVYAMELNDTFGIDSLNTERESVEENVGDKQFVGKEIETSCGSSVDFLCQGISTPICGAVEAVESRQSEVSGSKAECSKLVESEDAADGRLKVLSKPYALLEKGRQKLHHVWRKLAYEEDEDAVGDTSVRQECDTLTQGLAHAFRNVLAVTETASDVKDNEKGCMYETSGEDGGVVVQDQPIPGRSADKDLPDPPSDVSNLEQHCTSQPLSPSKKHRVPIVPSRKHHHEDFMQQKFQWHTAMLGSAPISKNEEPSTVTSQPKRRTSHASSCSSSASDTDMYSSYSGCDEIASSPKMSEANLPQLGHSMMGRRTSIDKPYFTALETPPSLRKCYEQSHDTCRISKNQQDIDHSSPEEEHVSSLGLGQSAQASTLDCKTSHKHHKKSSKKRSLKKVFTQEIPQLTKKAMGLRKSRSKESVTHEKKTRRLSEDYSGKPPLEAYYRRPASESKLSEAGCSSKRLQVPCTQPVVTDHKAAADQSKGVELTRSSVKSDNDQSCDM